MLKIRNLAWLDRRLEALDLTPGECVAVMGPSGAGKSRLLRAIADLDPCSGSVVVGDRAREDLSAPAWRRMVMYLPATPGWWAERIDAHFAEADRARASQLLGRLGLPAESLEWEVARLSTGEQQRVSLVRALLRQPTWLLLDEPTAALDESAAARVEVLLRAQLSEGVGMLLVTHDPAQARRLAGRKISLDRAVAEVSDL